jgi:hypothetical protein
MNPRFVSIANASRRAHVCASMRVSSIGSRGGAIKQAVLHVLQ